MPDIRFSSIVLISVVVKHICYYKGKTKDERLVLYERMTRRLFPHATKVVNLEGQLNEERKDYQRKFKEWFFVICKSSFSNGRFGETCFEFYKKSISINRKKKLFFKKRAFSLRR